MFRRRESTFPRGVAGGLLKDRQARSNFCADFVPATPIKSDHQGQDGGPQGCSKKINKLTRRQRFSLRTKEKSARRQKSLGVIAHSPWEDGGFDEIGAVFDRRICD